MYPCNHHACGMLAKSSVQTVGSRSDQSSKIFSRIDQADPGFQGSCPCLRINLPMSQLQDVSRSGITIGINSLNYPPEYQTVITLFTSSNKSNSRTGTDVALQKPCYVCGSLPTFCAKAVSPPSKPLNIARSNGSNLRSALTCVQLTIEIYLAPSPIGPREEGSFWNDL